MKQKFSRYTVLVAEDEQGTCDIVVKYLGQFFANVYIARNGKELLNIYKTSSPDIIISDIVMPVMDGLEAIREIREHDSFVRIIVMSAHSDTDKLLKAVRLGLTGYIIKPVNLSDINDVLVEAVTQLEARRKFQKVEEGLVSLGHNYVWNTAKETFFADETEIMFTKKERELLSLLILKRGYLCTFDEIINTVWGDDIFDDREISADNVKALVKKIRVKIEHNIIESRYGEGYLIAKH